MRFREYDPNRTFQAALVTFIILGSESREQRMTHTDLLTIAQQCQDLATSARNIGDAATSPLHASWCYGTADAHELIADQLYALVAQTMAAVAVGE